MNEKLTQAELARRWGLSRERIRQYCNEAEPMPLESEDVALAWLSSRHPDRAAKIIEKQLRAKPEAPDGLPAAADVGDTDGDGVETLLYRLRLSERSAWKALEAELLIDGEARSQMKIEARTRHYNECAAARQTMEERFVKYQLETRQCMRSADVVQFLGEVFAPINSQLNALPFSCASRANPTDPTMAQQAILDEVTKMRNELVAALEKIKEGEAR